MLISQVSRTERVYVLSECRSTLRRPKGDKTATLRVGLSREFCWVCASAASFSPRLYGASPELAVRYEGAFRPGRIPRVGRICESY